MNKPFTLIDTHCHIDFPQFDENREVLIQKSEQAGISLMIIPGVKQQGWLGIRQITATHEICHTALGLHPLFIEEHKETHLHDLENALSVGPITAIGEIGLDYYHSGSNRALQNHFFSVQLAMAKEANLPIILHVRKAHDEILRLLSHQKFVKGGVVHAFNGSEQQAGKYIDLGFKLGFGGAMTFPRAVKLHRLAKNLPLDSIVLETDAPDMKPVSCHLSYNTPLHLIDNFEQLSELREEPAEILARQTTKNALDVFNIE